MTHRRKLPTRRSLAVATLAGVGLLLLCPPWHLGGISLPDLELRAWQRALGAMGAPYAELDWQPWLDDTARATATELAASHPSLELVALRLPGYLAGLLLLALSGAFAHRTFGSVRAPVLAIAAVASTFSLSAMQSFAAGAPLAVLATTASILAGKHWATTQNPSKQPIALLTAIALSLLAISGAGIFWGLALPCLVVASHEALASRTRWLLAGLGVASLLAVGTLALGQVDGAIALLGAAKTLEALAGHPREMVAAISDLAQQTFPWLGLVVGGLVLPAADPEIRWAKRWLGLSVLAAGIWSSYYPSFILPIYPALALIVVHFLGETPKQGALVHGRGFAVSAAVFATWVAFADARHDPRAVLTGGLDSDSLLELPASLQQNWRNLCFLAAIALPLLTLLISNRAQQRRLPLRIGWITLIVACLVLPGAIYRQQIAPTWASANGFEAVVASMQSTGNSVLVTRLHDEPGFRESFGRRFKQIHAADRSDLLAQIDQHPDAVALVARKELAYLVRAGKRINQYLALVGQPREDLVWIKREIDPAQATGECPFEERIYEHVPAGFQRVEADFGDELTLVGWQEIAGFSPGSTFVADLIFEVKKPVPKSLDISARLQRGRIGRFTSPQNMSSTGDYPPDLWQVGEKIRQRIEIEIPRLLALPGTYDLLIFVKHKSTNLSARVAENKPENRGLKVRGGKKEALRIAQYIY